MQTLLEIIGSTIIGGMLLLLLLTSKTNVSKSSNSQLINSKMQSNLTTVTQIMETDLKNLGYRITDSTSITAADSNRITFKIVNDSTHTTDSISYYYTTGSASLFRKLNNSTPIQITVGITNFNLWYFDKNGAITSSKQLIKSFKIAITVQDTFKYDGDPVAAYWVKTFKPQNL